MRHNADGASVVPRRVLTLILAEAELELMPEELQRHPKVVARAKKRRRAPEHLLLDQALDHEAMRTLSDDAARRGRPDIAHFALLLAHDSLLMKRDLVRVLIHTRNDELVRVRPDTRIMRNQTKFVTLVEDLLRQGEVPLRDPLLTLERARPLASVLAEEARGQKVLLDEKGDFARSSSFADMFRRGDLTIVLGAFPRGPFRQADAAAFDRVVRVADEELTAWSALVPVIAGCEDAALARGL